MEPNFVAYGVKTLRREFTLRVNHYKSVCAIYFSCSSHYYSFLIGWIKTLILTCARNLMLKIVFLNKENKKQLFCCLGETTIVIQYYIYMGGDVNYPSVVVYYYTLHTNNSMWSILVILDISRKKK